MSFPRRRESTESIVDPGLRRGDKDLAMEPVGQAPRALDVDVRPAGGLTY